MARGFVYLVAVVDWATRRVLAWRLSNSLSADFCVEALREAIVRYGVPEIFNTDQGSQPRLTWSLQQCFDVQSVALHSMPRLAYANSVSSSAACSMQAPPA